MKLVTKAPQSRQAIRILLQIGLPLFLGSCNDDKNYGKVEYYRDFNIISKVGIQQIDSNRLEEFSYCNKVIWYADGSVAISVLETRKKNPIAYVTGFPFNSKNAYKIEFQNTSDPALVKYLIIDSICAVSYLFPNQVVYPDQTADVLYSEICKFKSFDYDGIVSIKDTSDMLRKFLRNEPIRISDTSNMKLRERRLDNNFTLATYIGLR